MKPCYVSGPLPAPTAPLGPLWTDGAWGGVRPLLPPRIRPWASPRPQEAWLLSRERELKEEIRRGRDKDIELVVRRLEADMTQAREESERAAESR